MPAKSSIQESCIQGGSIHSQVNSMRATIHIGNFPVPDHYGANAGNRLLLFAEILESGGAPIAHNGSPCANSSAGAMCEPPASTIVVLVSGLCVMVILVAIAVMLLLCSHMNRVQRQHRQQHAQEDVEIATDNGALGPNTSDGMVMVLLPGEKDSLTFARPCPLKGEITQGQDEASNELKTIESLFSDSEDLHGR
eukprot:c15570_g1_i1 orf=209-793(-)